MHIITRKRLNDLVTRARRYETRKGGRSLTATSGKNNEALDHSRASAFQPSVCFVPSALIFLTRDEFGPILSQPTFFIGLACRLTQEDAHDLRSHEVFYY
jgi:hypothetical protein